MELVIPKYRTPFLSQFRRYVGCWICVDLRENRYGVNKKLKGEMLGKAGFGCSEIMYKNSIGGTDKYQDSPL